MEAGNKFGPGYNLVLIEVENEEKLVQVAEHLERKGVSMVVFAEDYGRTALCTEPVTKEKRTLFKKYPLWKE